MRFTNNKIKKLWNKFKKSGKIEDFLSYSTLKRNQNKDEGSSKK